MVYIRFVHCVYDLTNFIGHGIQSTCIGSVKKNTTRHRINTKQKAHDYIINLEMLGSMPCFSLIYCRTSQQTTRAKVPRSWNGLEDGCWPTRSSSLPTSHRVYPGTTRHCDMVRHSQTRHHCGADCTLGGEHGRSLREKGRQRMGLPSDAHRGWLSWLHRSNDNLIPDQAWTNRQGQTEGHTAASNSSGKGIQLDLVQSQKEHHSMTKSPPLLSPSLPTPHPTPTFPHPPPPPPSLSPRVHTEHPKHLLPPVTSPDGWSCWRR